MEGLASTHDVLKTLRPLFSIAAGPGRSAGQLLPGIWWVGRFIGGFEGWCSSPVSHTDACQEKPRNRVE